MKKFKAVSLFCGCGGSDLGLLGGFTFNGMFYPPLNFIATCAIDNDPKAVKTFEANFDCENVICNDIRNVESFEVGDHDLLIGGFPCQSFSTVNPTKDPYDDRAVLYKEMVRIADELKPKVIVAENVKGFMKLHKGAIFNRVMSEFEHAGYLTFSKLINAADYGVPQKRERVFIVGIRKDLGIHYKFPKETHSSSGIPQGWVPLSVAVEKLDLDERKYYFSEKAVMGMKNAKPNMKRGLAQNLNEPCLTVTSHLAKASINSRDPVLLVDPIQELYRRFTPREASRIQSFPDSFKFIGSESDAYRQIGNSIPPVLFWHLANSIESILSDSLVRSSRESKPRKTKA